MNITVETIYFNVSEKFVDDYLLRLKQIPALPGCMNIAEELKQKGFAKLESNLAHGGGAVTTYKISMDLQKPDEAEDILKEYFETKSDDEAIEWQNRAKAFLKQNK